MRRAWAGLAVLAGCGVSTGMVETGPLDPPGPAECKVVFYRPFDRHPRRAYALHDDLEFVGFLPAGGAIEYLCGPGEHLFLLRGVTDAAVRADLEGGKTYYLRAGSRPAFLRLQLVLEPRPAADPEALAEIVEELSECIRLRTVPEEVDPYERESREEVSNRLAWYRGKGRDEGAVLRKEQGR